MRYSPRLVYFYLLSYLLISCQGKTEFIPPDLPERLCVTAIFDADDTNRTLIFEKSFQREYPENPLDPVNGLKFTIASGNNIIYEYSYDTAQPGIAKLPYSFKLPDSIIFLPGEKYTFRSGEENTDENYAEIVVPLEPPTFSVQYSGKTISTLPSFYWCNGPVNSAILDLSFEAEKNLYYTIMIEGRVDILINNYNDTYVGYSIIEANSPYFTSIIPGKKMSYFNDCLLHFIWIKAWKDYSTAFFDGNTIPEGICNLKIKIDMHNSLFDYTMPIKIKLTAIPSELYFFEKNYEQYRKTLFDPFTEPVYLNSNISGGFGIFSVSKSKSISMILPWEIIF